MRRSFKIELEEAKLNDVISITDEPVENAGLIDRVNVRKVRRIERARL